ncbi:toxin-antitoxin system YwqK family antitoxin [Helicobacter bilis]|nr:hypothetical protein [Helicobacter bilis]
MLERKYYYNGNLWVERPYKNDKIESIEKRYDENGKLRLESSVLNNLLHGDMRFYTEDKKLLTLIKTQGGKFISAKCFNDKALTNKDLEETDKLKSISQAIKYLQEICLKK